MIPRVAYLISPGLFDPHARTGTVCFQAERDGVPRGIYYIFQSDTINRYLISYLFVILSLPLYRPLTGDLGVVLIKNKVRISGDSGNSDITSSKHCTALHIVMYNPLSLQHQSYSLSLPHHYYILPRPEEARNAQPGERYS